MAAIDTHSAVTEPTPLDAHRAPTSEPLPGPSSELRWTAGMLWLIGLLPSMGLGLLLFDAWLAPVAAGALGVVLLSIIIVPASKLAIARAHRRLRRGARR